MEVTFKSKKPNEKRGSEATETFILQQYIRYFIYPPICLTDSYISPC